MDFTEKFIEYLLSIGKLEIIKRKNCYIARCKGIQTKGANISTALMLLTMEMRKK